jgi:hypothetical protein
VSSGNVRPPATSQEQYLSKNKATVGGSVERQEIVSEGECAKSSEVWYERIRATLCPREKVAAPSRREVRFSSGRCARKRRALILSPGLSESSTYVKGNDVRTSKRKVRPRGSTNKERLEE